MADLAIASPIDAPPAYEFAQLDFDQKLSVATERSLILSGDERRCQDASAEEQEQVCDEATFRLDEASIQADGLYAPVRPLNIRKKGKHASGPRGPLKERPAWFNEAHLGGSDSSSTSSQPGSSRRRSLPVPSEQQRRLGTPTQHAIPEEPEEDLSIPPPPFVPVDKSLDGPAYQLHVNDPRHRRTQSPIVVQRYSGEDLAASPPPSPPHSPVARNTTPGLTFRQRVPSPHINSGFQAYNHAQHHAAQQMRLQARPTSPPSTKQQRYEPPPPRMDFDPSVAYEGTKSVYGQLPMDTLKSGSGAAALYNSAVVPHLTWQASRKSASHKVKRYASSISSLPEYQPQQLQQSASLAQQVNAVHDLSASRASFSSQGTLNSIPQYPHIAEYPMPQGYTARPVPLGDQQRWPTVDK